MSEHVAFLSLSLISVAVSIVCRPLFLRIIFWYFFYEIKAICLLFLAARRVSDIRFAIPIYVANLEFGSFMEIVY